MTSGVTDRQQYRDIFVERQSKCFITPLVPVNGVVLVLEEIRRSCVGKAVWHDKSLRAHAGLADGLAGPLFSPIHFRKPGIMVPTNTLQK